MKVVEKAVVWHALHSFWHVIQGKFRKKEHRLFWKSMSLLYPFSFCLSLPPCMSCSNKIEQKNAYWRDVLFYCMHFIVVSVSVSLLCLYVKEKKNAGLRERKQSRERKRLSLSQYWNTLAERWNSGPTKQVGLWIHQTRNEFFQVSYHLAFWSQCVPNEGKQHRKGGG